MGHRSPDGRSSARREGKRSSRVHVDNLQSDGDSTFTMNASVEAGPDDAALAANTTTTTITSTTMPALSETQETISEVQPLPNGFGSPEMAPKMDISALRRLTKQLSHDISTEQLLSDQLVDAKVTEDDEGDGDEDEVVVSSSPPMSSPQSPSRKKKHKPKDRDRDREGGGKGMYRIESKSALSSLEAHHLKLPNEVNGGSELDLSKDPKERLSIGSTASNLASEPAYLAPLLTRKNTAASSKAAGAFAAMLQQVNNNNTTGVCSKCQVSREMPMMHYAAYSGHLTCLQLLLDQQDGNAACGSGNKFSQELDKKSRTPLFYSCAANRIDCCALLLSRRSQWRELADRQLDTPVHVCCFFGWHECLQKLLDAGANPHGRNAKGFKPSHIAKTKECLELLLSFGDDLVQGDKLGRTPLFVACARDRHLCVEFLCQWNHQTHSWMLEQEDQRGDRPIHAAACNGSVESLKVMGQKTILKYGADPLVPNGKGLNPKDLAQANNHPECVELLEAAERDIANNATWFAPVNAAAYVSSDNQQSFDEWSECYDVESGHAFYYNNITGKCQWEAPPGFTPKSPPASTQLVQDPATQEATQQEDDGEYVWVKKKKHTVCVVTGKNTEWISVQDPVSKAIYYKNTTTGESQWEEPDAVRKIQSESSANASQQASRLWDELNASRNGLAQAIAMEMARQNTALQAVLELQQKHFVKRRQEIQKKEATAHLASFLPSASFIKRKKQSMMIKMHGTGSANANANATASANSNPNASMPNCSSGIPPTIPEDEQFEKICEQEPALEIFLSTYLRLQGVRDLKISVEKRLYNCIFHYYVWTTDPLHGTTGGFSQGGVATSAGAGIPVMSKTLFRTVLRDAGILASSPKDLTAPLKLHMTDLVFTQAARTDRSIASSGISWPPSASSSTNALPVENVVLRHSAASTSSNASGGGSGATGDSQLALAGFANAMQLVCERAIAFAEENSKETIEEEDEKWFVATFVMPLCIKLGTKMVTRIRECKELDVAMTNLPSIHELFAQNRQQIQAIHRFYTNLERQTTKNASMRILSFRGLAAFAQDFGVVPTLCSIQVLYLIFEAVNWISGNSHTEIISFEKFQQLLALLAALLMDSASDANAIGSAPVARGSGMILNGSTMNNCANKNYVKLFQMFLKHLESSGGCHRIVASASVSCLVDSTKGSFFVAALETNQPSSHSPV